MKTKRLLLSIQKETFFLIDTKKLKWEKGTFFHVCSFPMAFASAIPCFSPLPPPKHSNSLLRRSQFSTSRQMYSSSHRSWSSSKQPQHREMAMPVRALGPRTPFLQAGFKDGRLHRRIHAKSMNTDIGGTSSIGFGTVGRFLLFHYSFYFF